MCVLMEHEGNHSGFIYTTIGAHDRPYHSSDACERYDIEEIKHGPGYVRLCKQAQSLDKDCACCVLITKGFIDFV
ncbi:hypothetical protein COE03_31200 [Bacillus thuringiensis]|nr:hypothetical protein COE03_31200 [Bacillus thuringiensis]